MVLFMKYICIVKGKNTKLFYQTKFQKKKKKIKKIIL